MLLLGLLLAAVPFGFGALRAATSGTDFRYLALAIGSCVAALAVLRTAKAAGGPTLMRIVLAFAAAAGVGVALGLAQGATSAPATLVVAGGFALCEAVGLGVALRARAG